jgi:hypothetical protein
MKPIVNGLQKEHAGRVETVKLNVSDPRTAEAKAKYTYTFRGQPYFVLLDGEGEVVNTWQGHTEKAFFDEQFSAVLGR